MTKLSYIWTSSDNKETKEFSTHPQLMAWVDGHGGHYKAIYTPIVHETTWTISPLRREIMTGARDKT